MNSEPVQVFRCGWTWWRRLHVAFWHVIGGAFAFLAVAPAATVLWFVALHVSRWGRVFPGFMPLAGWLMMAGVFLVMGVNAVFSFHAGRAELRAARTWRAEVSPEGLRVGDWRGMREVRWEDISALEFLTGPGLHMNSERRLDFPTGITDGRRLFALIAERAGLTERRGGWVRGVRLVRPEAGAATGGQEVP